MAKKTQKKQNKKPKNELTLMVNNSIIKPAQALWIAQQTPQQHIHKRVAKGGGQWSYVTGAYIRQVLNYVFSYMWDFEIKNHGKEGNLVWVLGRLIIKDKSGNPKIVKEQFGRADIKFKRGEKTPMDFGNDLKAAATDSMKKCASLLGIAADVYNENEFKLIQKEDKGFVPPQNDKVVPAKAEVIDPAKDKVVELMGMLEGKTDKQKLADIKKKIGIVLPSFRITQKHSSILIASVLNAKAIKK